MPIRKEFHTPKGIITRELTAEEVLQYRELPPNPYFGTVAAYDRTKVKPCQITFEWMGYKWTWDCYVSQDVEDYHGTGKIAAGDTVSFIFMEHDYSKPLVTQKLYKP